MVNGGFFRLLYGYCRAVVFKFANKSKKKKKRLLIRSVFFPCHRRSSPSAVPPKKGPGGSRLETELTYDNFAQSGCSHGTRDFYQAMTITPKQ